MLPKWIMEYKYVVMIVLILVTCVAMYVQTWNVTHESFDVPVPIKYTDAAKTKLVAGYYQIDNTTMMPIPYGYAIDPSNTKHIKPKTQAATQSLAVNKKTPPYPSPGMWIPDGYYALTDSSLGVLPPNMMPKVNHVDVSYNTIPPRLLVYYDPGYVSSVAYYKATFPTPVSVKSFLATAAKPPYTSVNPPPAPPPTMYFADACFNTVSFLPYGKIQDPSNGYGYVGNPNLISQTGQFEYNNTNFRDIADNYNLDYHTSAEDLMKSDSSFDSNTNTMTILDNSGTPVKIPYSGSYKTMTVYDQQGNPVVIPYSAMQGTVTYYQPGSFPFGGSTYIPNYEDSVYMSRSTQLATTSPYTPSSGALGACDAYQNLPAQQEEYCRTLDAETCSSTSCCVLLGGAKCVAGNETGPLYKNNYGDYLLRNKDAYYYNGKCYGNCV
jgi:hypothetical protein